MGAGNSHPGQLGLSKESSWLQNRKMPGELRPQAQSGSGAPLRRSKEIVRSLSCSVSQLFPCVGVLLRQAPQCGGRSGSLPPCDPSSQEAGWEWGHPCPNSESPKAASHWPSLGHMLTPGPIISGRVRPPLTPPSNAAGVGEVGTNDPARRSRCPSQSGTCRPGRQQQRMPTCSLEQRWELKRPHSEPPGSSQATCSWWTTVQSSHQLWSLPRASPRTPRCRQGLAQGPRWRSASSTVLPAIQAGGPWEGGGRAYLQWLVLGAREFLARISFPERTRRSSLVAPGAFLPGPPPCMAFSFVLNAGAILLPSTSEEVTTSCTRSRWV